MQPSPSEQPSPEDDERIHGLNKSPLVYIEPLPTHTIDSWKDYGTVHGTPPGKGSPEWHLAKDDDAVPRGALRSGTIREQPYESPPWRLASDDSTLQQGETRSGKVRQQAHTVNEEAAWYDLAEQGFPAEELSQLIENSQDTHAAAAKASVFLASSTKDLSWLSTMAKYPQHKDMIIAGF